MNFNQVYKYRLSVSSPLDINRLKPLRRYHGCGIPVFGKWLFCFLFRNNWYKQENCQKKNRLKLKDRAIARSDFYAKRLVVISFNNYSTRACWIRYFVRLPETLTFWRKHLFQCIWVIDQVWGQNSWMLAKFFICLFMDRDEVEVHKLAKTKTNK